MRSDFSLNKYFGEDFPNFSKHNVLSTAHVPLHELLFEEKSERSRPSEHPPVRGKTC